MTPPNRLPARLDISHNLQTHPHSPLVPSEFDGKSAGNFATSAGTNIHLSTVECTVNQPPKALAISGGRDRDVDHLAARLHPSCGARNSYFGTSPLWPPAVVPGRIMFVTATFARSIQRDNRSASVGLSSAAPLEECNRQARAGSSATHVLQHTTHLTPLAIRVAERTPQQPLQTSPRVLLNR